MDCSESVLIQKTAQPMTDSRSRDGGKYVILLLFWPLLPGLATPYLISHGQWSATVLLRVHWQRQYVVKEHDPEPHFTCF